MREQPKVWCDAACGAKCGPNYTAAAAEQRAVEHEENCHLCQAVKSSDIKVRQSPYDEPAPKKNPAPAVGQRREWEGEKYTIVDQIDHLFSIRFDSDGATDSLSSFAVEALADDRYLGQASKCNTCQGFLRPGEFHLVCGQKAETAAAIRERVESATERNRLLAKAASTCPNCRTTVPRGQIHFCDDPTLEPASRALRKQVKGRGECLRRLGAEVVEAGTSAVAKAPGVRDWMMGLADEWDLLPDA